jgi:hypothetical protein
MLMLDCSWSFFLPRSAENWQGKKCLSNVNSSFLPEKLKMKGIVPNKRKNYKSI